jgi:hypothetical protein
MMKMSDANAKQYEAYCYLPGRAERYQKPNRQRHFGKRQINMSWQLISLRVGQKTIKDEEVRGRAETQPYNIAVSRHFYSEYRCAHQAGFSYAALSNLRSSASITATKIGHFPQPVRKTSGYRGSRMG